MSENRSLTVGFEGWIPQSSTTYATALTEGLVSLDANVLLDLYRFGDAGRQAMLDVLGALGDRVWVSHQAAREFWRNRIQTIDDRNAVTADVLKLLSNHRQAALDRIKAWAKATAVPELSEAPIREALEGAAATIRQLIETEAEESGQFGHDVEHDSVASALLTLLDGKVGPPLGAGEREAAMVEAARRADRGLPPGFADAKKAETGNPDAAAGDYLVWYQSLLEAKRRDLPLVIVTRDQKADWWWLHNHKNPRGPRQELVDECLRETGQPFYLLPTRALIDHADVVKVKVTEDAAQAVVRAITEDSDGDDYVPWRRDAVDALLEQLDYEDAVQADVIRRAADLGGIIERAEIYEIAEYEEGRTLKGFTRPVNRITSQLIHDGIVDQRVSPMLSPIYDGGVWALRFEIPIEVAEMLCDDSGE